MLVIRSLILEWVDKENELIPFHFVTYTLQSNLYERLSTGNVEATTYLTKG